jgi:phosphate starvation-inducible protein PhoH
MTKPRYLSNYSPSPFCYRSLRMMSEDSKENEHEEFEMISSAITKREKGKDKKGKDKKDKKDSFMKGSLTKTYIPKTENQKKYVDLLNNPENSIMVVVGPAGSGKTLFACIHSIQLLQAGKIRKIVLTRPMISVEEEEFGFLPGDLVSKMDPWTKPIFDIFKEFYTPLQITEMITQEIIEIAPLAFMRGRTFHDAFIIADEMQNSSPNQMLMLSTRIGNGSKMVITGDLQQSDRASGVNGLNDFLNKYKIWEGQTNSVEIGLIEMTQKDVSRSKTVSTILDFYRISTPVSHPDEKKPSSNGGADYKKNSDSALMPLKDIVRSFRADTYL